MKSLFLLISSTFSFYFFVKFWNIVGLNKAVMDLVLLQGELRPEWKRQCLEPGWSGDLCFGVHMAFLIWYMALTSRQVSCPAISPLWDSWSALTLRSPNMEVLGGCPAQIFSNHPKSLQTSGDIMENSITSCHGSMWQGNTASVFWSTFQVKIV